jgi:hypothetical protein
MDPIPNNQPTPPASPPDRRPFENQAGSNPEPVGGFTISGLEAADLLADSLSPSDVLLSRIVGDTKVKNVSPAEVREDLGTTPFVAETYSAVSVQEVGRGGMSVVFGALHEDLQVVHAIKVMTRPVTDEAFARFKDEARRLAQLDHSNVIRVYHTDKTTLGRPFFVMTFVPGGQTLKDKIEGYHDAHANNVPAREWRREQQPLLDIITTILGALEDVHATKIIHRDIKPTNILVASATAVDKCGGIAPGQVFLADFGLSTNADELGSDSHPRPFEGTPQYAAPEQVDHTLGKISRTTDVYQMGLILWEALTNRTPFEGERRLDVILKKLASAASAQELYGDILSFKSDLPAELVAIVYKALARNPQDRYQSAAEFRKDIKAFQRGEGVAAYKDSVPLAQAALYQMQLLYRSSAHWVGGHKAASAALIAATALGAGTLEAQRREGVRETEQQIADVKRAELNRRAEDALKRSQDATGRGDLEIAQAQVASDLLESLRQNGDSRSRALAQTIEAERKERQDLLDLRKVAAQGYLAAVESLNPTELEGFNYEKLAEAVTIYLPEGITDTGIAVFKARFSHSSLALSEKIEILDMLTELSMLLFLRDFDIKTPLTPERYELALEELARIGSLADACNIRIGGQIVRSVIPPDFTVVLQRKNGQLPTPTSRRSSVALRTDSFFQALYNAPPPHFTWSDPGVADVLKLCAVALRRIEEPRPSNIGASVFASALELRDPSPEAKVRALQSTLNATKAARKVGVDNFHLQARAILLAGDIAGRLRAEVGGDTDGSTGSEPMLIQAQLIALELLGQNGRDVDPKLLDAHCRIARQLPSEPAPNAIERLCQFPAYKREGELSKAWYQMQQRVDNPMSPLDRDLCLRVALDSTNQREEPLLTIQLFDALERYDDAVSVMRQHAERFPAFRGKLGYLLRNPIFSPNTLRERREAIEQLSKGR